MIAAILLSLVQGAGAPDAASNLPAQTPAAEVPAPTSDMPVEARNHNNRGVALITAGDFADGIAELERAYASMPDPLQYRVGRGKVLGSLRSALAQRYVATREPVHLCRSRELLRRHRAALLAALGPAGGTADVAGTDQAIREIDATLGNRPCGDPTQPQKTPPPTAAPKPHPAPPLLHPPIDATQRAVRRHRVAGGTLLGVAGLATVGSAIAAAIYGDRYRRLDALDRWLMTPEQIAAKERLHDQGRFARTSAIIMGSAAGVLLVAGVAVLVAAPRRPSRMSVAPSVAPGAWGLHVRGQF
jgi:hypothetical protein